MESTSNDNGHECTPRKAHLIGIHSHRGGSGKTTLAANLAFLAARRGAKVAVLDADLQAPALHHALGVETKRILHSVSEFVKGQCAIEEVPIDLSREAGIEEPGRLYFLPASTDVTTTSSILFEGYDVSRLNDHLRQLCEQLDLDYLLLDTHHGTNREMLLSLATSDTVLILLRPDGHDREGASLLVQMANKVGVPDCLLVPNGLAPDVDPDTWSAEVERALGASVACVLPWSRELTELGCRGIFAVHHPEHPLVAQMERILEGSILGEAYRRGAA